MDGEEECIPLFISFWVL